MPALTSTAPARTSADRLLDGTDTRPEPLRQLLAAAAAPAQPGELRGEQAARLAFTTSARSGPLPDLTPHHSPHHSLRRSRALSWIVAAKAIAAVALTAGAGGVAVAATSSSFPDNPPDVSTHQQSDPGTATTRPTVVVDRARDAVLQPESTGTPTRTASPARPDQSGRSAADAAPEGDTPATRPTVAGKKSTAESLPVPQKKEKEQKKANGGSNAADPEKDRPGDSDHIGNPRSDTAKQKQEAGQE